MAEAPAPVAPDLAEAAPVSRRERRPDAPQSARRGPRPTADLARAPRTPTPSAPTPARVARASRPDLPAPQGSSPARPGLAGVPLGDLAACVSDREEDRLKEAVVAAVTTQEECVSRAGTYRFVETKNLNSFLMWIDRASGRAVGDRCDELRHALECLHSANRRAAR